MTNISNDIEESRKHIERMHELTRERGRILALPPEQALNEILEHPQPQALVHSFAEEDFFFLIHDIGPEDSLELLSLASDRQWEYILDIESWSKDRINLNAVTYWLNLLLQADPGRFTQWAMTEKPELIEYYIHKTSEVLIREHDQDPSDFGDDFMTLDDIFYVKIPEAPEDSDADPGILEKQNAFLTQILNRLADADHRLYQQTLLRSVTVTSAECEEELYRFHNVRLAEKGFQPFAEAVGIYQPIRLTDMKKRKKYLPKEKNIETFVPIPLNHRALMEKDNIFSRALSLITIEDAFQQIQIEFAGLCNQITAADRRPVHEREELKAVIKKVCGYLSIGLERLSGKNCQSDDNRIAALIKAYPLIDIFRTGYSQIAKLKDQAEKWRKSSWFAARKLALSFWGEELVGVLGGLLIKRPQFFNNYKTGVLYREFETMTEVRQTRAALAEVMAFDDLMSCLSVDTENFPADFFITYKNLLLTLWARHELGLPADPHPIHIDLFKTLYTDLWAKTGKNAAVKDSKKTDLLKWLAQKSGFTEDEISKNIGLALERLFAQIAEEYGNVKFKDLDPRFMQLFMLEKK